MPQFSDIPFASDVAELLHSREVFEALPQGQPMTPIKKGSTHRQADPPDATSFRKTALAAGVLYLITFVSIPTLSLYAAFHGPNYITGPGPEAPVIIGHHL